MALFPSLYRRPGVRHTALGPVIWRRIDTAESTDRLAQTAWQRAIADIGALYDRSRGFLPVAQGIVLAVVIAVLMGSLWWRIVVAVVAGIAAFWAVPTVCAVVAWPFEPMRQRNEARAALAARKTAVPNPSQVFQDELTAAMTAGVENAPDPAWVDDTHALIARRANTAEAALFRTKGRDLPLVDEIAAKVEWIRNDLWPKVRGNFFS